MIHKLDHEIVFLGLFLFLHYQNDHVSSQNGFVNSLKKINALVTVCLALSPSRVEQKQCLQRILEIIHNHWHFLIGTSKTSSLRHRFSKPMDLQAETQVETVISTEFPLTWDIRRFLNVLNLVTYYSSHVIKIQTGMQFQKNPVPSTSYTCLCAWSLSVITIFNLHGIISNSDNIEGILVLCELRCLLNLSNQTLQTRKWSEKFYDFALNKIQILDNLLSILSRTIYSESTAYKLSQILWKYNV